jgi:hypothetical protein
MNSVAQEHKVKRGIHHLKAVQVEQTKTPGLYGDGGGLYLQITRQGSRSWIFRYKRDGRTRKMGLGPTHLVDLREARDKAHAARRQLFDGIDPLGERRTVVRAQARASIAPTFRTAAATYIEAHSPT